MKHRKPLSKLTRFEVFKRDSFTCQYCGKKAPEIILEVDHIVPVCKSGTDDILNLITSCEACNRGKAGRELSDNTIIEKRHKQLSDLQERKEQIEMMFEWQNGLIEVENVAIENLCKMWSELTVDYSLNQLGKNTLKKLIKKYDINIMIHALRTAAENYLDFVDGIPTHASVEFAFNKVSGICNIKSLEKEKPYLFDLYYIRGILCNRFGRKGKFGTLNLMDKCMMLHADIDGIRTVATQCNSLDEFNAACNNFIDENSNKTITGDDQCQ